MKIGLFNPGEMGGGVGGALVRSGHTVLWASDGRSGSTVERAERFGLTDVGSVQAVVESSDIIMSICPPHAAIEVAESVAGFTGLFFDANAISIATAQEVAAIVEKGGATYVDGGIVGSPPPSDNNTLVYISGTHAQEIADLFAEGEVVLTVLAGDPYSASGLKMCYAAYTKGTWALLLNIRAMARATNVEEELTAMWQARFPDLPGKSLQAARQAEARGWRWDGEMLEIAANFRASGLPGGFHEAAAEIYRRSPRGDESAKATEETLNTVLEALLRQS